MTMVSMPRSVVLSLVFLFCLVFSCQLLFLPLEGNFLNFANFAKNCYHRPRSHQLLVKFFFPGSADWGYPPPYIYCISYFQCTVRLYCHIDMTKNHDCNIK